MRKSSKFNWYGRVYYERFAGEKLTKVGRDKVTSGMIVVSCAIDQSWCSWKVGSQEKKFGLEIEEDGMNHCNCFNGLINQVIYLDDTSDVHLEIEGFRKQG